MSYIGFSSLSDSHKFQSSKDDCFSIKLYKYSNTNGLWPNSINNEIVPARLSTKLTAEPEEKGSIMGECLGLNIGEGSSKSITVAPIFFGTPIRIASSTSESFTEIERYHFTRQINGAILHRVVTSTSTATGTTYPNYAIPLLKYDSIMTPSSYDYKNDARLYVASGYSTIYLYAVIAGDNDIIIYSRVNSVSSIFYAGVDAMIAVYLKEA